MKPIGKRLLCMLCAAVMMLSVCMTGCGELTSLGEYTDLFIVETGLKTTYNVGDTFDYDAVRLRAVYTEGEKSLTGKDAGVTHNTLDMNTAGKQTLTYTYEGKSASVDINIIEVVDELTSIHIGALKTAYKVGEEFDYDAVKITANYTTRTVELTLKSEGVTHNILDMSKAGKQTLTVNYEGKSDSVEITVTEEEIVKTLERIEIITGDQKNFTVEQNSTVDYALFSLRLHYNTGDSETIALDTDGVSYEPIDTSTPGKQTLTVTYMQKTATAEFTVTEEEITVTLYSLPESYAKFVAANKDDPDGTKSEKRDIFMKAAGEYLAGDDNALVLQPVAQGGKTIEDIGVLPDISTTHTVALKNDDGTYDDPLSADEEAVYVTQKADKPTSYFYFTQEAIGKSFRIALTLDEKYKTDGVNEKTVYVDVTVVDGYNVYDQTGLSVLDNLNVNHWKAIKEAAGTLAWDLKPLAEYNNVDKSDGSEPSPVSRIILHGDIEIDPDDLPDYYFWDKDRQVTGTDGKDYGNQGFDSAQSNMNAANIPEVLKTNLNGSLRDYSPDAIHAGWQNFSDPDNGACAEDYHPEWVNMQKGIYNSSGTAISGNLFTLSYKTEGAVHKLYTVYDGKQTPASNPLSHWSLIKYPDEGFLANGNSGTAVNKEVLNGGSPLVENLRIKGSSPRVQESEGQPAHLMAFNTCMNDLNLDNVIISQLFVAAIGDCANNGGANIHVHNSKIYDINSNMFYAWRATIEVENCIMQEAGGPVFILCDGDRTGTPDDGNGPHLITDRASRLESFAGGTESWYKLNDATALFTQMKGLNLLAQGFLGINYLHAGASNPEIQLVNVVAIVIPEPANIMKPASDAASILQVSGTVTRKDADGQAGETYMMNGFNTGSSDTDAALNGGLAAAKGQLAPILRSNLCMAVADPINQKMVSISPQTEDVSTMKAAWAESVKTSDWLFMHFNAGALLQSATCPYFAILVGGVEAVPAQ